MDEWGNDDPSGLSDDLMGLTIMGEDEFGSSSLDDDLLRDYPELAGSLGAAEKDILSSPDPQEGMSTISDTLLRRVQHMSHSVQAATLGILKDQAIVQPRGVDRGRQIEDTKLAQEVLGNVTGTDIAPFVRSLERGLEPWMQGFHEQGKIPHINDPKDYYTALGMITTSAEGYLQTGGTSGLAGKRAAIQSTEDIPYDVTGQRTQAQEDEAFATKQAFFDESSLALAEQYFTPAGLQADKSGRRVRRVQEAILKYARDADLPTRFLKNHLGEYIRDDKGQPRIKSDLPTPGDLGVLKVPGIKPTMGTFVKDAMGQYGDSFGGSPYATVSAYQQAIPKLQKQGLTDVEIARLEPSGANTIAKGEARKELTDKFKNLRKQFRQFSVTDTDLAYGNQEKRISLDSTVDDAAQEQAQFYENVNTAQVLGIDMTEYAGQAEGETRSAYSDKLQELEDAGATDLLAFELSQEGGGFVGPMNVPQAGTERGEYLRRAGGPIQGSDAWLKQREGKVTASKLTGLKPEGMAEGIAVGLVKEGLGLDTFVGNAYTARGSLMEDEAAKAFAKKTGLVVEEAYFEAHKEVRNIGISPDGYVFDKAGRSQGLIEIKNLTDKNFGEFGKQYDKYYNQMQLQMAVTGEEQVHFVARNADTGEIQTRMAYADPEIQDQLLKAGERAGELADEALASTSPHSRLRALEAEMAAKMKGPKKAKREREAAQRKETAQRNRESTFRGSNVEADEPIISFNQTMETGGRTADEAADEAATREHYTRLFMEGEKRLKDLERIEADEAKASKKADREKEVSRQATKAEEADRQAQAEEAKAVSEENTSKIINGNPNMAHTVGSEPRTKDHMMYQEMFDKELRDALKETTEDVKNFGANLRNAGGVLSELAGQGRMGNETGMGTIASAALAGADANQVRGVEDVLARGGLSERAVTQTTQAVSGRLAQFRDVAQGAQAFSQMEVARAQSTVESVRTAQLAGLDQLKSMDFAQYTAYAQDMIDAQPSAAGKAQMADILGVPQMAASRADGEAIATAMGNIDVEAQYDTRTGIATVDQGVRDARELAAENVAGEVIAGAEVVGGIATSATVGFGIGTLTTAAGKGGRVTSAVQSLSKLASTKNLTSVVSAAKKVPIGTIAKGASLAAVPELTRMIAGIEDDNSLADSGMDVLEFAAYGATIGSVVPGVGTAIGAGVGGAVGLANEAWEWFSADDVVPTSDIERTPQTNQQQPMTKIQNNINVSNEISPELIRTTTDVNGDLNTNEDGVSTGGW